MKRYTFSIFSFFFLLIIFAAAALRFYHLGTSPRGALIDEASIGYNAYSILKTGKDEHGVHFPLVFRAFGDQKLPAYIYLDVPFVAVFGLNNTAVRLPSAVAGVFFVIAIFFLLREIGIKRWTSALGSLIAAVSPWSIILSRFGYESNLALLGFTIGLIFFFRALRTKSIKDFMLCGIFFGTTWYTYIAYRMITLLFLCLSALFLLYKKQIKIKQLSIMFIAFLLIILPILPLSFSGSGTARFTQIGILSDPGPLQVILEQRNFCSEHLPKPVCYAVWNKPTVYGGLFVERFITLLSPQYLFQKGDVFLPYLNVDNYGQFFAILLPFYLMGIFALFIRAKGKTPSLPFFIVLGVLASSLPSMLAGEPQKIRLSGLLPFIIIIMTVGIEYISAPLSKTQKYIGSLLLIIALLISAGAFLVAFLTVHIDKYDFAFNTPVAKLMEYLKKQDTKVQIQIFPSFSDPIMQYAYLAQIDPADYQKNVVWAELEPSGFQHAAKLHNIEVTHDDYTGKPCTLYVTDRDLNLTPYALKLQIKSTNGVYTMLNVYSENTLLWCKALETP